MKNLILSILLCLSSLSLKAADSGITLYGTPLSPYARKVISVLEHKKVTYRLDPTLPATLLKATGQIVPKELEEASPLGKIPAIRVQEGTLADSSVIAAYLEKKYPQMPLYPQDPYILAESLWFEQYADTEMSDVFHRLMVEKVVNPLVLKKPTDIHEVDKLLSKIPSILDYLEKALAHKRSLFLVSDELTIGDIAVLHQFYGLQIAEVQIDLSFYPLIKAYIDRGMAHPTLVETIRKIP